MKNKKDSGQVTMVTFIRWDGSQAGQIPLAELVKNGAWKPWVNK